MNSFKLLVSGLALALLTSCFPEGGVQREIVTIERDDREYDRRIREDEDRDRVMRTSRERRSGNTCEEELERDRDAQCREDCKEIYNRRGDRDDCEELTVAQIEVLLDLYELLEDPDEDDLNDIDPEDFDVYLNVSIESLDDLVDDEWNRREAREFLFWLINNEDSARVFEKEDDDYKTLTAILDEINNFDFRNIDEPFTTKLDDDKLMEVAIDSGNEMIIEWFMDYINDKNPACDSESVSKECFRVYCRIGEGIHDDFMEDWLSYDAFESYIEDIIDEGINSTTPSIVLRDDSEDAGDGWEYGGGQDQFENINDIRDDWVDELCGTLGR
ncbi:MAG: hypothetical protein OXC37_02605 [Bdellovibrionaceae bacterium]|nr:hypothetical protein [Pseudobdellovibrionaceae bacterium]